MTKSEILQATTRRRAIKKFTSRKIPDDDWQFLLEIARLAPSSFGFEPWNILQIDSPVIREKLIPALGTNKDRLTASHFVIFTIKTDLAPDSKYFRENLKQHGVNALVRKGFMLHFAKFQKSQQDLADARKRHDWAAKQAYIAFAQMIFAAAEIGIDSCPIEGFDKNLAETILAENKILNLETDSLALMAAFGYRATDPAYPKTRRDLAEIVKVV